MLALCGSGDTISSILRSTANQLSTTDALRDRMSSINSLFTSSGPQLGPIRERRGRRQDRHEAFRAHRRLGDTGDRRHGHSVVPASAPVSN